jgi:hypothetical protein
MDECGSAPWQCSEGGAAGGLPPTVGRPFDVDSGLLVAEQDWHVGKGMAKLQLSVDVQTAY